MPTAKCLGVEYFAGSFELVQGVKRYEQDGMGDGWYFRNRGYGWGEVIKSSKLILFAIVKDCKGTQEIWIDRFFKDHLGRLTEKRRLMIKQTMPETIEVSKTESQRGTEYYIASEADLNTWLDRCNDPANIERADVEAKTRSREAEEKFSREYVLLLKQEHECELKEAAELQERRERALKLAFVKGRNPKYKSEQWEARHKNVLYVLRHEDIYEPSEGRVSVEKVMDLIPGRVALVKRI